MIVSALTAVKPKTKPRALGEVTEKYIDTLVLMRDNGEIIKEVKTSLANSIKPPIISKSGKWILQTGRLSAREWDIGLINTETGEIILDHGLAYHILLENPQLPYKATRFRKGYEKLGKFGGIYEYPEDEIIRIMNMYAAMGLKPWHGWRSFSNNEKIMTVDARNEIRIYDLETLELIDILTYDEIQKAFMKAKTPRKVMRWMTKAVFSGIINAENPDLIWIRAASSNCIIALMDIEDRKIVSPIKHPYELLKKHDMAPYIKFIPNIDNPWNNGLKGVKIRFDPTPTKNILLRIKISWEKTNAPPQKSPLRTKYDIPLFAHEQVILMLLDPDLEPVAWLHKFNVDGIECVTEGFPFSPICPYPDYLVLVGSNFQTLGPDLKEVFGWLRVDWKTLRPRMYVDSEIVDEALFNEIDIEDPYLLRCLPDNYAPRIYKDELLVGGKIEAPSERQGIDYEHVFIARYDIKARKAHVLQVWESRYPAGIECPSLYRWGAFI